MALAPVATAATGPGKPTAAVASAPLTVELDRPAVSTAEFVVSISTVGDNALVAGQPLAATWTNPATGEPHRVDVVVDADGIARFVAQAWKSITVDIEYGGITASTLIKIAPTQKPVVLPAKAPHPAQKYSNNPDPAAAGTGPNLKITQVSASTRKTMIGRSWHAGCIAFGALREVRVNYWGVDGYRYRGLLIANASVAKKVAAAFAVLYSKGVRFRSIHPVDVYGRNPRGPGANDYASMAAGNTSMFNCRFIVGKESMRAVSPHASGRAIDVNPWENPYIARGGIYPNSWWLPRIPSRPMVLTSNSIVVKVLRAHGARWGAYFGDYQHFDFW